MGSGGEKKKEYRTTTAQPNLCRLEGGGGSVEEGALRTLGVRLQVGFEGDSWNDGSQGKKETEGRRTFIKGKWISMQ